MPMVALGCGVAMLPDVVIKNSPMNSQVSILHLKTPITPFALGDLCAEKKLNATISASILANTPMIN